MLGKTEGRRRRDDRGRDGWMASLTGGTWVWASSRSWWWTEKPGVLQFMGLQIVGHNWATELDWFYFSKTNEQSNTFLGWLFNLRPEMVMDRWRVGWREHCRWKAPMCKALRQKEWGPCNCRITDARGAQEGGSRAPSQAGGNTGLTPRGCRPP